MHRISILLLSAIYVTDSVEKCVDKTKEEYYNKMSIEYSLIKSG